MKVTKSINAPIVITLTLSAFTSCNAQVDREIKDIVEHAKTFGIGDTVSAMGTDLDCILQDNDSIYWFAGNGGGVYRYDGNTIIHITMKDGLYGKFVWGIKRT